MKGEKPGYSQVKPALCSAFNPYYSTVSTISPAAWASIQSYAYTGGHAVAADGAPVLSAEDSLYPHSTKWRKKTSVGGLVTSYHHHLLVMGGFCEPLRCRAQRREQRAPTPCAKWGPPKMWRSDENSCRATALPYGRRPARGGAAPTPNGHTSPTHSFSNYLAARATSHGLSDTLKKLRTRNLSCLLTSRNPAKRRAKGPSTLEGQQPSHKALKSTSGPIQLPADRNASPLTSTAENLSSSDSDDDFDEEEVEVDRPTRPIPRSYSLAPSPAPTPSAAAQSPPPQSPADTTMGDGDDDMNAAAAGPPFVLPTARVLAAIVPAARARNPHLKSQTASATPAVDPNLGRAHIQHNAGQFPAHIMENGRMVKDIMPTQLDDFKESTDHKFLLPLANGGDHLFNVTFETPLATQIEAALRTLAPDGNIRVRIPIPDPDARRNSKYSGPSSAMVEVSDDAGAAAITAQKTFGVHSGLGFWAHDFDANADVVIWCFGHFDMVVPGGDPADIEANARGGFIRAAYEDGPIYRRLDQATQAKGGDAKRRVFEPVVVGYIEPVTTNAAEQEELNSLLRRLTFYAGNYGFTTRSPLGHAPECALCKTADHPAFLCPYSKPELGWWGPPAQLSELPPENPLYIGGGGGNNDGGGGRGRGGASRGYSRGGGNRGSPYGRGGGYGYRGGGGWRNTRGGGRGRGNARGY
ncbi:hypothetical protein B0H13DRAFT_2553551 [Mycena leptocephala]|nr:hypothetical protein B0H13DRAFT_2553551 [Mycena leptocephala]